MFLPNLKSIWFLFIADVITAAMCNTKVRNVFTDKGRDVLLPCFGVKDDDMSSVIWVHHGNHSAHTVLDDGSLQLKGVDENDAGIYECSLDNDTEYIDKYNLTVRTPPPPLINVTVHASTILALILWEVQGDGGHPIRDFTAEYRSTLPDDTGMLEDWIEISPTHISPNSRQIDVYHLTPNETYAFRVWATNILGPGEPVEVLATTTITHPLDELKKHFLRDAETFDTRTWLVAVGIVMSALVVLSLAVILMLASECRRDDDDDFEGMELLPNIIMNPGFGGPVKTYASQVVKSSECPGPGEPRKQRAKPQTSSDTSKS